MSVYRFLLDEFKLGHLTLKNRVFSAAHAPGYTEEGLPKARYQAYHEEKAKGGVGLTVIGGSSNISRDSGSIYGQIYVGDHRVIPYFQQLADRVHAHDTAVFCQITHMGRRTSWDSGDWFATQGPSVIRDPAHHSVPCELRPLDIKRITQSFADAAWRCQQGGLDGCEILATTHLLGQFLSPLSNQRNDAYGGELANRMRFLVEVLEAVREKVGEQFIVGVRFAADESNEDGLPANEGVEIGRLLGEHGVADYLNINGRYGGTTVGMAETFPGMAYGSAPYIELARQVREVSKLPTLQSAGLGDAATANHAIEAGCLDLAGLTRPLMADPHFVNKLKAQREEQIRPCVGAGYCIDRIYGGKDSFCLHSVSTGRETILPHQISTATEQKKVLVIGGGVAGMEAARVCAERGHQVTLWEASGQLGGQLLLAARAGWRKDMNGISAWLIRELERLAVTVHYHQYADAEQIKSEQTDIVILATGGIPEVQLPQGGEQWAHSTWDVLSAEVKVEAGQKVLVYDEAAGHAAVSLADHLGSQGVQVTMATPDRHIARAVGGLNYPVYLRHLYAQNTILLPDHRLMGLQHEADGFVTAVFRNEFSRETLKQAYELVVVDQLTAPMNDIFLELADESVNLGHCDSEALIAQQPQPTTNPEGQYLLFRVGDAVAARDIHAALLDANRLCRAL